MENSVSKSLFVFGTMRSGTSLLSAALSAHSRLGVVWQPYLAFFKHCRNAYLIRHGKSRECAYPMGITNPGADFLHVFSDVQFDNNTQEKMLYEITEYLHTESKGINDNMIPQGLASFVKKYISLHETQSAGTILDKLMLAVRDYLTSNFDKRKYVFSGIKETFCEQFIGPILLDTAVSGKVIHIIRDPRAVIASRNYGTYRKVTGSRYPLHFIILLWKKSVAQYFTYQNYNDYTMVRYEDLVTEPETTMSKCCSFLGVEYEEAMIDPEQYVDSAGKKWKQNGSFGNGKTISDVSVDKWKEVLNEKEIQVIEYYCKKEMDMLGYDRKSNGSSNPDYPEEKKDIRNWLQDFNFKEILEKENV